MKKKNTVALGIFLGTSLSLMALTSKESPIISINPKLSQQYIVKLEKEKRFLKQQIQKLQRHLKQQIQKLQGRRPTGQIRSALRLYQERLGNITNTIRSIRRKL